MPVAVAVSGVMIGPFSIEDERPGVAEDLVYADGGALVGDAEALRSGVSGTVRGRPPWKRPACDSVPSAIVRSGASSSPLPSSSASNLCVFDVSSGNVARVGLRVRVGRSKGAGDDRELNAPVFWRPTVEGENRGPPRGREGGGDVLLRAWGGELVLTARGGDKSGEEGEERPVRVGVRRPTSERWGRLACRRSRVPKYLLWQFLLRGLSINLHARGRKAYQYGWGMRASEYTQQRRMGRRTS